MGSQQLLIITLVVFVAGLAIWTGVRLTRSYSQASERDTVLHQMNVVVGEAKKYHASPKSIGGGEGAFTGFVPSPRNVTTDRVRIYTTVGDDWVLLQGFGAVVGYDGIEPVQVVAQYRQSLKDWETITNVN